MTGLGSIVLLGAIAFAQQGAADQPQVGGQAPALNLLDLKGQVFVLEFINPTDEKWQELHQNRTLRSDGPLKATYDRYKAEGIVWLAICPFEDPAAQQGEAPAGELQGVARMGRRNLMQEVQELGIGVPVLFDEGCKIAKSFGVTQLPHIVVVDKQGNVAFSQRLRGETGDMVGLDTFDRTLGEAINAPYDATTLPAGSPREPQATPPTDDDDLDDDDR